MTRRPKDRLSEYQRADADTVMFASLQAAPSADAPPGSRAPDPGTRVTRAERILGPGRGGRHAPASHPRRTRVSRLVLLLIMVMQAALTLRMRNTAFEDEALYLYVGHLEIAHWLHGAALQGDYPSYFSGAPVLYPVLGALADSIGGLTAARALSLAEMLTVTGLLYTTSRRLFNERVALCGTLIFAVAEPTLFLGNLATYDATSLCLLAVAMWLVVRTAYFRWPGYLLAAPVLVLAVATKYAALLFVPPVVVLAGLAAPGISRRKAVLAPVTLGVTTGALLFGALYLGGADYFTGIKFTTLTRFQGDNSASSLLWDSAQWIGIPFALAVIGAVAYAYRPFTERGEEIAPAGGRLRRALLGALMAGSALLAPAEQIRIHTFTSLQKHVGFGLLLAAPIIGVGLARVIGDHFRRTQIGIAVWGAALAVGMTQANNLFNSWPNSSVLVADMARYLRPGAHYLVEVDEVPIYYLRQHSDAQPSQFTSTYYIGVVGQQGQFLTGNAGYVAAIKAGYFQMIAYNYQTTPAVDTVIASALAADPQYRLAAVIPNGNDTVRQYLWVKISP
ncbi:MAG TPA: glycosyltransferase family 39 protein [Trebonia sp.]|nr:glycosyltransferase family 39 protein [Trebonia sp.]